MSSHLVAPATPSSIRQSSVAPSQAPSPHYTTTRRHSLYGTEDRIVIDPGSRVWKVGFSGEGRPREVFSVVPGSARVPRPVSGVASGSSRRERTTNDGETLWPDLSGKSTTEREEALVLLENRLQDLLRNMFFESLLVDPRSRKVIIVEHPLLPLAVKDALVRVLFLNLQVQSISFAPTHLLSLIACGRMTGLALDCGYQDSTSMPIYGSRLLYSCMKTTPLAGSRLNTQIRTLLLKHAKYTPPLGVVSTTIPQQTAVPEDVLTDAVIEIVKTRCCFVSEPIVLTRPGSPVAASTTFLTGTGTGTAPSSASAVGDDSASEQGERETTSSRRSSIASNSMDVDPPASSSGAASRSRSIIPSTPGSSSSPHLPAVSSSRASPRPPGSASALHSSHQTVPPIIRRRDLYIQQSQATDLTLRIPGPAAAPNAILSKAALHIPGWVRERAAEILFEEGDMDEASLAEVIVESLLKAPMDLRRELASSILVSGGTAMLPGFIGRLHTEVVKLLQDPNAVEDDLDNTLHHGPTLSPTTPRPGRSFPAAVSQRSPKRRYDPYESLRPLIPYVAVINNPNPPTSQSSLASRKAGKAPGFAPAALPWIGGSLAGALKISSEEIHRERWEEAFESARDQENLVTVPPLAPSTRMPSATTPTATPALLPSSPSLPSLRSSVRSPGGTAHLLADWSKPPMRHGAGVYAAG